MNAVGTQPGTDYDALAGAIAKALEPLVSAQRTVEIVREVQIQPETGLGNGLGNDFPSVSQAVATPSKMELAKKWLIENPGDLSLTGRDLEKLRSPMGVKISYKTWNDAKKNLG